MVADTHVTNVVAPDHRNDNTILVAALTLVGGQNLDQWVLPVHQRGEKLDLLAIGGDDANVFLLDSAGNERGDQLFRRTTVSYLCRKNAINA